MSDHSIRQASHPNTVSASEKRPVAKPSFGDHSVAVQPSDGAVVGKSGSAIPGTVKVEDLDPLLERDVETASGATALVKLVTNLDMKEGIECAAGMFHQYFHRDARGALDLLNTGHFTKHMGDDAHKDSSVLRDILGHGNFKLSVSGEDGVQPASVDALLKHVDGNTDLGSPAFFDKIADILGQMSETGMDVRGVAKDAERAAEKYDKAHPDSGLDMAAFKKEMESVEKGERAEVGLKSENGEEPVAKGGEGSEGIKEFVPLDPNAVSGVYTDIQEEANMVDLREAAVSYSNSFPGASDFQAKVQDTFDLYDRVTTGKISDDELRERVGSFDSREDGLANLQQQVKDDVQVLALVGANDVIDGGSVLEDHDWFRSMVTGYGSNDNGPNADKVYVDTFLDQLATGSTDAARVSSWIQDVLESIKANEVDSLLTSVFDLVASPETNPSFMIAIQETLDATVNDTYDISKQVKDKIRQGIEDAEDRGIQVMRRDAE